MLPKVFLTALLAVPYVAALAVPPQADAANVVVRSEGEVAAEPLWTRDETDAVVEVSDGIDVDKAGKGRKGKGKGHKGKGKGHKGKGKGHKGKGKGHKGKGKGEGKGKGGRKGKGERKGKGGRKGKGERKGKFDSSEAAE